jgi:2,3-bisphosphoglycerate-dependent phosphoglycerate mutase
VTIAFRQYATLTIIGPGGLLHALCSTIAVKLENGNWGARFPHIMNELYQGSLPADRAPAAMAEAQTIRSELAKLPPTEIVWDIEKPGARPPWGDQVGPHITNMAQIFITDTGRNLVDELVDNIESQLEFGGPLEIVQFDGKR